MTPEAAATSSHSSRSNDAQKNAASEAEPAQVFAVGTAEVATALTPDAIVTLLDTYAKKGKLPGFRRAEKGAGGGSDLFVTAAFSAPFDHEMIVSHSAGGKGTTLRFRLRMLPKLPTIMLIVLVLTVWPGVWLTDSMMSTYFGWYRLSFWWTCAWYLPLTILPVPWMWRKWVGGSRAAAEEHAGEIVADLRKWLDS